jgi:hypothetical protein
VAKGNGRGNAPVVVGGEEVVGELPGSVRKLGAGSIGVEEGWRRVTHREQEAAASGARRQWCPGRNWRMIGGR